MSGYSQDKLKVLGMYSHVIGEDRRNAVERVAALLRPTDDASCAQLRPNRDLKRSGFNKLVGAGDGNRTHVRGLGSRYSTIEPRPLGPTLPDRSRFRQVSVGNEFSPHNASRDCLLRSFFSGPFRMRSWKSLVEKSCYAVRLPYCNLGTWEGRRGL